MEESGGLPGGGLGVGGGGSSLLGPVSGNGSQSQPGGKKKLSVRNFQKRLGPQLGNE